MAQTRNVGIAYPFRTSRKGFFVGMTTTAREAVKSNLAHYLLTPRGSRYMNPTFGTNLFVYVFEPLDDKTVEALKSEINTEIEQNFSGLKIVNLVVEVDTERRMVGLEVVFEITDGILRETDILKVKF